MAAARRGDPPRGRRSQSCRDGRADQRRRRRIDVEIEEERGRSRHDHRRLRRRHRALVHAVGHAARARHRVDGGGVSKARIASFSGYGGWCAKRRPRALRERRRHAREFSPDAETLRRASHRAVAAVTVAIERLRFNAAVAHMLRACQRALHCLAEFAAPSPGRTSPSRFGRRAEFITRISAPMMPHLAEDCWARLAMTGLSAEEPWPRPESALLRRGNHHNRRAGEW